MVPKTMVEIATRGVKRFASGMSWSMVSFRAGIATREIADRRTMTENPRLPIQRMAEAMCAYRTTSSRMSAMPAAIHDQEMNSPTCLPCLHAD